MARTETHSFYKTDSRACIHQSERWTRKTKWRAPHSRCIQPNNYYSGDWLIICGIGTQIARFMRMGNGRLAKCRAPCRNAQTRIRYIYIYMLVMPNVCLAIAREWNYRLRVMCVGTIRATHTICDGKIWCAHVKRPRKVRLYSNRMP